MKKVWTLILIALPLLVGCGNKDNADKIKLKMGIVPGVQSNEYKAAKKLSEDLANKTKGEITLEIFPDSQLGDDREMLEQVSAGQLDIAFAESGRLGLWIKEAEIFQLPYIFDNFEHLKRSLFDSEEGKKLIEKAKKEQGWLILGDAYNGTRQTSSNRAINKLEDMKGMKLRVPNAYANLSYAKYIGTSPTPMAFTEVYLALQTNAVDGQENPLSAIKTSKFYEVQKYIALTNHIINDQCYIVSDKTYKKLSEDHKRILKETIVEASEYHTRLFIEDEKTLIEFFEQNGVTITKPSLENVNIMMKPIYDEYISKNGEIGKDLYNSIEEKK